MKKVLTISHYGNLKGMFDHYLDYLEKQPYELSSLKHPFNDYEERQPHKLINTPGLSNDKNKFTVFLNNKETKKIKRHDFGILNLFFDFFISIYFILNNKVDVFIGGNKFDTFTGIFAKFVLRKNIKKIIYFGSDFIPENRFDNFLLNYIYNIMEMICSKKSDLVTSSTKRAEEERIAIGLKKEKSILILNGIPLKSDLSLNKKLNKGKFIFVGHLSLEHGLYEMIEVMSPLINHLTIIGYGSELKRVINLCEEKDIPFNVFYKKSHDFCIDYMKKFNGFGLAPYLSYPSRLAYYGSPLKIFEYIACKVPLITSDISEVSNEIKKQNLGIVYNKLDLLKIKKSIENFNSNNFNSAAENFTEKYNSDLFYSSIKI